MNPDKNIENRFYDLLSRKLSGEITNVEIFQLKEMIALYPEWRFLYDRLMTPSVEKIPIERIDEAYALHYVNKLQLEGLLEKKEHQPALAKTHHGRTNKWAYAALFTGIAFFIAYVFFINHKTAVLSSNKSKIAENDIVTTKGSHSKVVLPDGTIVYLNQHSRLYYDQISKDKDTREVNLTGEAFFDVKHDPAHPFIIHTHQADIKVLGTAFNVRSYDNENFFETALIRGKVEISLKKQGHKKIILSPSQKVVIPTVEKVNVENTIALDEVQIKDIVMKDSLIAETAWIQNKLVFVNKSLEDIAAELESTFGIKVIFESEKCKKYNYTGVFDNTNLDDILKILKLSKTFHYQFDGQKLIIN